MIYSKTSQLTPNFKKNSNRDFTTIENEPFDTNNSLFNILSTNIISCETDDYSNRKGELDPEINSIDIATTENQTEKEINKFGISDIPKNQNFILPDKRGKNHLKKGRNSFTNKNEIEKDESNAQNKLNVLSTCYDELDAMFSKYSFAEISQLILKIMNNIGEEDKKNVKPYEKLKCIISKLKNKESLLIMCFSILSKKCLLKKDCSEYENTSKIKKESPNKESTHFEENSKPCLDRNQKEDLLQNEIRINNKLRFYEYPSIINSMINTAKIGVHYYKSEEGEIFSYSHIKQARPSICLPIKLSCNKTKSKCGAQCIIFNSNNKVSVKLIGSHKHTNGIKKSYFFSQYQFLFEKKWEHIQIFKNKDMVTVVRFC